MSLMRIAFDWLFILLSSYLAIKALDRLLMKENSSLGNYVIAVTWVFCVLPVIFDYLIGLPEYRTVYWYSPFIVPMKDDSVSIVYDCTILFTVLGLHFYCVAYIRKGEKGAALAWSTPLGECEPLLCLGMVLPVIYVVLGGLLPYLASYGDAGTRDMPDGSSSAVNSLLLIGLLSGAIWAFKRQKRPSLRLFVLGIYSFVVAWISGKRFMIALMLMVYLFFILSGDVPQATRRKIRRLTPVAMMLLTAFSAFYLIGVRPLSDISFDSIYEMLRVDFGRDDVTKYVIYHELFLGDHILQYPGQSLLSTFFVFVPRFLWTTKPFQHFQYLTSSILGLPVSLLPAGTTPSWWDMCIANLSYFGLMAGPLLLVGLVALADKAKTVSIRGTLLVLLVALLTQSIDAYISLVLLLAVQQGLAFFVSGRQAVGKPRGKRAVHEGAWRHGY